MRLQNSCNIPLHHTLLLSHPFKCRKVFCFTAVSKNIVVFSNITLCSFYQIKWRNILKDKLFIVILSSHSCIALRSTLLSIFLPKFCYTIKTYSILQKCSVPLFFLHWQMFGAKVIKHLFV